MPTNTELGRALEPFRAPGGNIFEEKNGQLLEAFGHQVSKVVAAELLQNKIRSRSHTIPGDIYLSPVP